MIDLITPIDFDSSLREWRDHYRRKSFTLARSTMMDMHESFPRRPETLFLLGLTELAARDVSHAEEHYSELAEMLDSGNFERAEFFREHEKAIRALTPWILSGLANRSLYAAPYDPWLWLKNWEEVIKTRPTPAGALVFQPLGRTESILEGEVRSREMRRLPRLMDELRVEPVKVDTMKGLLGRDADLTIDKHRTRIIDDSIIIEKPLLRAADGTYKPLLTVDVQRPRWDAVHKAPPRTVSDLAPSVKIPPLPKIEPFEILPAAVLPSVVFEMPNFPSMASLSGMNLPGATPVDMTPIVIERPVIPTTPEIQGLNRELDKQPKPPSTMKPPPPPIAPTVMIPQFEPAKPAAPAPAPPRPQIKPVPQTAEPQQRVAPPSRDTRGTTETRVPIAPSMEQPARAGREATFGQAMGGAAVAATVATSATAAARSDSPWDKWENEVNELMAKGAITEALRRASEAVDKYPQSARLEEFRGGLLERVGRLEEAAKSYVEAFRKARESGAAERGKRALDRAKQLAQRSGPLMLEVGTLLAALGATGIAATLLVGAADHYRRNGERKRLVQILDLLRRISGTNPSAIEEVRRLEGEVGSVVREARALAPEVRSVAGELQPRTKPPRASVAPRLSAHETQQAGRRAEQARLADVQVAGKGAKKTSPNNSAMDGKSLFSISVVVLVFTLLTGWIVPPLVGGVFALLNIVTPTEPKPTVASRLLSVASLGIFFLAFLLSLFF